MEQAERKQEEALKRKGEFKRKMDNKARDDSTILVPNQKVFNGPISTQGTP
jgi:hypothetical protein